MNNKIADLFLSWLYPDDGRCAICGVSASTNPLCPVCASEAYSFAATCQKMKLKSIHSVYALMPYEAELKHLLHELKYGNKPRIARKLALAIGQCLREKVLQYDCLTYVPMHKERYLVRGYNQAELLADEVSKLTGVKKETLIARVKKTPPQHLLTKIDRQKNVSQAFAAVGDSSGKRVLLIDDILTSGSTAEECARAILSSGARQVSVLVVAIALKHE